MTKELTPKQLAALKLIQQYLKQKGRGPYISEFMKELGIKTKRGVIQYLQALEKKGQIFRINNVPGGIRIPGDDDYFINVRILGFANAGKPLVNAEEENLGEIQIQASLLDNTKDVFGVIIKGDSMNLKELNHVPLENGNIVVVDKNRLPNSGDVVLAVIDNMATLKTFKRTKHTIVLYPESTNQVHRPIYLDGLSDFYINGVVVTALENPVKS